MYEAAKPLQPGFTRMHHCCPSTWLQRIAYATRSPAYQNRQNVKTLEASLKKCFKIQLNQTRGKKLPLFSFKANIAPLFPQKIAANRAFWSPFGQ
jgi:hypothetical protein